MPLTEDIALLVIPEKIQPSIVAFINGTLDAEMPTVTESCPVIE